MSEPQWSVGQVERLLERLRERRDGLPQLVLRGNPGAVPGLEAAVRSLASMTGGLLEMRTGDGREGELPGVVVRHPTRGEVGVWSARPVGPEAVPFLEFLGASFAPIRPGAAGDGRPGRPWVEVLIAPGCPNCPRAVRAVAELVADGIAASLHVVDATVFPEEARRLGVTSVPVTVAGDLVLTGVRPGTGLARHLESWGARRWMEGVLEAHLQEGRVEAAAGLLGAGEALEAFVRLWGRSTFSTRLGLLLAAETALEGSPRALDDVVPELIGLLDSPDPPLRGDTADLLGSIGHPGARPALERLAADPDQEVAEAAREALDRLSPVRPERE